VAPASSSSSEPADDILDLPELRDVTIALHDIDAERLETAA
jgi:hypothetical protein